jgi:hypothetical protein
MQHKGITQREQKQQAKKKRKIEEVRGQLEQKQQAKKKR